MGALNNKIWCIGRILIFIILGFNIFTIGTAKELRILPFQKNTIFRFADVEYGRRLLTTNDDFINNLSPFDRISRMGVIGRDVTVDEFIKYIGSQVEAWSADDIKKVMTSVKNAADTFSKLELKLYLPPEITLIKTTGKEEGGTSYTTNNAIVLSSSKLGNIISELEILIAHEIFHIVMKNNPETAKQLNQILGFKPCNDIRNELPESINRYRITNPDAPSYRYYKEIGVEGKVIQAIPILLSGSEYKGGSFFKYIGKKMIAVVGEDVQKKIQYDNGKPILYSYDQVNGLYDTIGRDTSYNYNPEEVLAKYFEFLYLQRKDLKDQQIITEMKLLLSR